eukprot:m.209123 g.209123  ORF g.209123 m.209123 type:complete len:2833 (-) comp15551_c7_seq5:71-8569(-)
MGDSRQSSAASTTLELNSTVRYGDHIILEVAEKGVVHSQLFGDNVPGRLVMRPFASGEPVFALQNLKTSVFLIQPRSNHEAQLRHKEALRRLSQLQTSHVDVSDGSVSSTANPEYQRARDEELEARRRAESEQHENECEQRRRKGQILCYEDVFQLTHVYTRRVLAIATERASLVDPSDYGCELVDPSLCDAQCWFRFLPRTATLTGARIVFEDKLFLQSVAAPECFLFLTAPPLSNRHPEHGAQEIAFSSQVEPARTLFTLRWFRSEAERESETVLCGGDVIQLYHKDWSNVLAATCQPPQDPHGLAPIAAGPHMRVRRGARSASEGTCDPTTYWQVEHAMSPMLSGRPVEAGACIRLVHMPSQQYLCHKNLRFSLVPKNGSHASTLFQLTSATQNEGRLLRAGMAVHLSCVANGERDSPEGAQAHHRGRVIPQAVVGVRGITTVFSDNPAAHIPTPTFDGQTPPLPIASPRPVPPAAAAAGLFSSSSSLQDSPSVPRKGITSPESTGPASFSTQQCCSPPSLDDLPVRGARGASGAGPVPAAPDRGVRRLSVSVLQSNKMKFGWDHTDKAELQALPLVATESPRTDFLLAIPSVDQVDSLADCQGFRVMLLALRAGLASLDELDEQAWDNVDAVFESFRAWLDCASQGRVRRKMMRGSMVVDELTLLMKVISARLSQYQDQTLSLTALAGNCCVLLESFARGTSEKNLLYLAQYLNEFRQIAERLPQAFGLMRCILSSPRVVMSHEHDLTIPRFPSPDLLLQLLDHFCHLCVCGSKSAPTNQNAIFTAVLPHLWRFSLQNKQIVVAHHGTVERLLPSPAQPTLFERLVATQWRLIGALCAGPNEVLINRLEGQGYLNRQVFFHCLADPRFHVCLQESCLWVMRMLIAYDPAEFDQHLRDSLVDSNLCYNSLVLATFRRAIEAPARATPFHRQVMLCIEWLHDYTTHASLVSESVHLLLVLARRGYFRQREMTEKLMSSLCARVQLMLNMAENTADTWDVLLVPVIQIVEALYNYNFNRRMQALMCDFVHLRQATMMHTDSAYCDAVVREGALVNTNARPLLRDSPRLYAALKDLAVMKVADETSPEVCQAQAHQAEAIDYLRELWQEFNWLFPAWDPSVPLTAARTPDQPKTFVHLLVKLVAKPVKSRLLHAAFGLLDRTVCAHDHLLRLAIPAQLLCHRTTRTLGERLDAILPDIRALSSEGIALLRNTELTSMVIRHLEELQTFCIYEGEEAEPNAQNQLVLRNYNIISYVLDILFVAKFEQHSPLVLPALKLLRLMCQKSPDVQQDLFLELDRLLFAASTYYAAVTPACRREFSALIAAVFKLNYKCSMEVRPAQIQKILQLVITWELDGLLLLTALRNLCTVYSEDRVIAGNQATVLNHLYGGFKHVAECYGVGSTPAALEARYSLTAPASAATAGLSASRAFHRELILTIATCCLESDGRKVDSRVKRLFLPETIIDILRAHPPDGIAEAYLAFFYSVFVKPYFPTQGESPVMPRHLQQLIDAPALWQILNQHSSASLALVEQLRLSRDLLSTANSEALQRLDVLFCSYLPIMTVLLGFLTHDQRRLVLPDPQRVEGLHAAQTLLAAMSEVFSPLPSAQMPHPLLLCLPPHYARHLRDAVAAISSYIESKSGSSVDGGLDKIRSLSDAFAAADDLLSDTAKFQSLVATKYQIEYYKEIEINSHYNTYCTALKIAYLGPFKVDHQLRDSQVLPPFYHRTDRDVRALVARPLFEPDVSSGLDSCNKTNGLPRLGPGFLNFLRLLETTEKPQLLHRRLLSSFKLNPDKSNILSDRKSRVSELSDLSALSNTTTLLASELHEHMARYGCNYGANSRAIALSRVLSASSESSERNLILQRELQTAVFFALRGILNKAEIVDTLSTAYRPRLQLAIDALCGVFPSLLGEPRPPPKQSVIRVNMRRKLIVPDHESGPSVLPHLIRAVHAGSFVAVEALSTLEALLRQGTNMRLFAEIVGGHNCEFFGDLADLMGHSIFLLQQAQKLQQSADSDSAPEAPAVEEPRKKTKDKEKDTHSGVGSATITETSLGGDVPAQAAPRWGVTGGGEYKGFIKPNYDELTSSEGAKMTLLLRLIDALCDNDNTTLKQLMRHQPNSQRSANILGLVVRMLDTATRSFEFFTVKSARGGDEHRKNALAGNIALAIECLRAMQSMCTGCDPNRREAVRSMLCDTVMKNIFRHHKRIVDFLASDLEKLHHFLTLEVYSLQILMVVMEDDDLTTTQIAKEMITILTPEDFIRILLPICFVSTDRANDGRYRRLTLKDERPDQVDTFDQNDLDRARGALVCSIIVIFKRISELSRRESNVLRDAIAHDKSLQRVGGIKHQSPRECLEHLLDDCETRFVFTVEIVRSGSLNRIYFIDVRREWQPRNLVQWTNLQYGHAVRRVMRWMGRETPPTPDTQLSSDFKPILDQVAMCNLEQRPKELVEKCCEILDERQYRLLKPQFFVSDFCRQSFDYLLVAVAVIINVIILATWNAPRLFQDTRPIVDEFDFEGVLVGLGVIEVLVALFILLGHIFTHMREPLQLLSPLTAYCVSLPVMAILGILTYGYLFCYHLFHVIRISKDIMHVVRAVTQNIKMIISIFLLIVLVVHVYSLAAFAFLRFEYVPKQGLYCDTALQCLVTNLNYGIRGVLVDALYVKAIAFDDISTRVLFDLSFFLLLNVVALNVVLGVIVDTFSEIREEDNRLRETKRSECLICGISRKDIDKNSTSTFVQHVSEQHNRIHYLRFFQYLRDKAERHRRNPTRNPPLTSHELYVYRQVTPDSLGRLHWDFVPTKQALCLTNAVDNGSAADTHAEQSLLRSMKELIKKAGK